MTTTAIRTDTGTTHLVTDEFAVTTLCGQPMLMVGRWMFGDELAEDLLSEFGARTCGNCRRFA